MKRLFYFLSIAALTLGFMISCGTDTPPKGSLNAPTGLEAIDVTHDSATLKWQHPDADKYEVVFNGGEAETVTGLTLKLDNLTPETKYTWKVRSGKGDAWSEWADGPEFTTKAVPGPDTVPNPTDLEATNVTFRSARLKWQHPDADKHEVVFDNGEAITVTEPGYEVIDLTPETSYTWKVRSGKGDIWSEWVDGPEFTTKIEPFVDTPIRLEATTITINSTFLVWSHPANSPVYKYEVVVNDGEAIPITEPWAQDGIGTYIWSCQINDLTPGTTQTWKVRASINGAWSQWSESTFDTRSMDLLPKVSDFVLVEGGTFSMGNDADYAYPYESPVHDVTLSSFHISKYEVTQIQWLAIMGVDTRSMWTPELDPNLPAESISYDGAVEFIKRLNAVTDGKYALPTEAQWEFAARGGNESQGYKYSGSDNIDDVAWYMGNYGAYGYQPIGTKAPNELGIYDMSGNLYEWCSDFYGAYPSSPQTDPTGPSSGNYRVLRGGCSWNFPGLNYGTVPPSLDEEISHVTYRAESLARSPGSGPATGFRLVRKL